jgi:hypothetical protein
LLYRVSRVQSQILPAIGPDFPKFPEYFPTTRTANPMFADKTQAVGGKNRGVISQIMGPPSTGKNDLSHG